MFVLSGKKELSACLLIKLLFITVTRYKDRSCCHGGGKSSNGLSLEGGGGYIKGVGTVQSRCKDHSIFKVR